MARGRSSSVRTIQVYRKQKRQGKRTSKRGFAKKFGGNLLDNVERSLGKGMLYGGVASKIIPGIAPIATLYGEWQGGGLEGLAINEFLVKPFIGLPSQLSSILGPGGLLGNLGGLFGGQGGSGSPMPAQIV